MDHLLLGNYFLMVNGSGSLKTIMPWGTLGDPLPYIAGSYHKATTFEIENNMSPLEYIINIVWQEN
jgi:hypothetical protein